jgi:hypothetical protein
MLANGASTTFSCYNIFKRYIHRKLFVHAVTEIFLAIFSFKRSNVGETLKYQSPYLSWSEIRLTAAAARCIFMNKQISAPTLDIANYTKWDTFSGCLFSPRTHTHTRRCSAHAERAHKVEKRERKQTGRRGKIVVYYTQY